MDSMTVDISGLPDDALGLGSLVEVIGPHQTIEALAADAGTIAYEILTGLGSRFRREYR
ncbi:alanine racemase [Bradyrhizobium sp. GM6.1]